MGERAYPVQLPRLSDSRLHVASVLLTVQLLGQVALGFELSIAQILVSLGTCVVIEVALTFWQHRVIAWPASALLTGNGVALILRVDGTQHGDWWSMNGWHLFSATAALGLLSKYMIRYRDRPLFNPSNLGLVACFLIVGSQRVNPLDFWWGPMSGGLVLAYLVILTGGIAVGARNALLGMSAAFAVTFAAGLGGLAATGHCMTARWSLTPVCGGSFWWSVAASPEVLIFLFFMLTDPRTTPRSRDGRMLFGAAVGVLAVVLIAPHHTEFWTKVMLLTALVVACGIRPVASRLLAGPEPLTMSRRVALSGIAVVAIAVAPLVSSQTTPDGLGPVDAPQATVRLAPGVVPVVTISQTVESVLGSIDRAAAQQIGALVAADLLGDGDRTFDSMELTIHRDPSNPQAIPQLAVRATGTAAGAAFDEVRVIEMGAGGYTVRRPSPAGSS